MTNTYVSKVRAAVNDNQVVVFNLMVSCMSAERQFDLTKLGIDIAKLPSGSRKLVQEKIFPKEFLNNYTRLRDRANAVLDRGAAVRLDMGVISSRTEAVAKIKDLNAIKLDWANLLESDSHRYHDICNKRIALIAAEAFKEGVPADVVNTLVDSLRKRQPLWEDFKSRMTFSYSPVPLTLELDEDKANFDPVLFEAQRDGLVALREGVFGALVQYLARESSSILKVINEKKPHHGVYTINYRTVSRIAEITEKLHGLSFIHQQVAPLAMIIDEALSFMPKSTEKDLGLKPAQFLNLVTCLDAISDQHELLSRLRDKAPLVQVSEVEPILVPQSPASINTVTTTGGAGAVIAAPVVAQQTEAEIEASSEEEIEAETVDQPEFMSGLSFMGSSLFD